LKRTALCYDDTIKDYILNKEKEFLLTEKKLKVVKDFFRDCNITNPVLRAYHNELMEKSQERRCQAHSI